MPPDSEGEAPEKERDLLGSVCHDLKEPLASIMMGTGFLRKALRGGDESALRIVDAIHRSAARMSQRVSTFADLARLEARELRLEIRPHGVAALLRAAFEQIGPEATPRGVSVAIDLDQGLRERDVACDRERLLQILRQLSACALRVVPGGTLLALGATRGTDETIRFEVRATPPSTSRRVAAALPKPELAIAKGLIELHGAALAIDSQQASLALSFALRQAGR